MCCNRMQPCLQRCSLLFAALRSSTAAVVSCCSRTERAKLRGHGMGDSPAAAGVGSQHKPLLSCGCGSVSCPFVTLKAALNGCTRQTSDTFSSWVSQHTTCTWCDGDGSCVEVATSAPSGRGSQITGCTVFDTSVFHQDYLNHNTQLCGLAFVRDPQHEGCRSSLAKHVRKLNLLMKDALVCRTLPHQLYPPKLHAFCMAGGDVGALCNLAAQPLQATHKPPAAPNAPAAMTAATIAASNAAPSAPAAMTAAPSAATSAASNAASNAGTQLKKARVLINGIRQLISGDEGIQMLCTPILNDLELTLDDLGCGHQIVSPTAKAPPYAKPRAAAATVSESTPAGLRIMAKTVATQTAANGRQARPPICSVVRPQATSRRREHWLRLSLRQVCTGHTSDV